MSIDFITFVDDDEQISQEQDLFCDEPNSQEAELFSEEPAPHAKEPVLDDIQAQTIKTALDQPVISGWHHDLALGPKIAVFGVGGAGCNALGSLVRSGFDAATMVALNTDIQDLHLCPVSDRVVLGPELCRGRGAGGKPEVGALAAQESRPQIEAHLQDVDMAFVVFGAGGGTGSGAGPEICHMARELGCLTVAIVTKPFSEEGKRRRRHATESYEALKHAADSTVIVANDHIEKLCDDDASVAAGFEIADGILSDAVFGMVCLARSPATGRGKLNVDFQDVRTVMEDRQSALIGIGVASGPNRANEALEAAISSPLLEDATLEGATGLLCHIRYGSEPLTVRENRQINALLNEAVDEDAEIINGFCEDPSLGDSIAILVVATGFDMNPRRDTAEGSVVERAPMSDVRPARVASRAEVSADWRLGTAAERHQQRMEALAKRQEQSTYQAPPSRVASAHIEDHNIRRTASYQPELGMQPKDLPVADAASFNPPKRQPEQQPDFAGYSQPAALVASCDEEPGSAAERRAHEGPPSRRPAVQFAAPEIDSGDKNFTFAGTDDGEPSGQYIENLTSLVPQPAAQQPQYVAASAAQPFAMAQGVGAPKAVPARQQMMEADPVHLERGPQQNLLGIDDDVDLPPFLRR
jgi:cell division protein FtsZ